MQKFLRKALFIKIILLALAVFPLSAGTRDDFHFTLSPLFGTKFSKTGEALYSSGNSHLLSLLDWDEFPSWNFTLDFTASWKNLELLCTAGTDLPFKCGTMTDSDWLGTVTEKTKLGTFDNYINGNFDAGVLFDYRFILAEGFSLAPAFGGCFDYINYSGKNGYAVFGYVDESAEKQNVRLSGIDYRQKTFLVLTGLNLVFTKDRLSLSTALYTSPFTYIEAYDYHSDETNKGKDFSTLSFHIASFFYYDTEFTADYKLKDTLSLVTAIKMIYYPEIKGPTLYAKGVPESNNDYEPLNQLSGDSTCKAVISAGLKLYF